MGVFELQSKRRKNGENVENGKFTGGFELPSKRRENGEKRRENGENVNPMSEHRLVSSQLGRVMNWVDRLRTSANAWVLSGRRAVVIV